MSETKMITVIGRPMPITPCKQKLPPELKAKWLEALRSGQHKQDKDELFRDKGYCCLGVLSLVQGRLVHIAGRARDGGPTCSAIGLDPTNPVAFVDDHGVLDTDIAKRGLATLNDDGATFAELADVIEYAF